MEVSHYVRKHGKDSPVYKARIGVPYWMVNSKGKVENRFYILAEHTDLKEFGDYLNRGQILIPKNERKAK